MALAALLATTGPASGAQPQQSFWELVVNDVPHGTVVAVLDGDRVWLPVAALEKAGLRGFDGRRETLFGEPHVLLRSLEPGITTTLDTVNVVMRLTAAPQYLPETEVTLQRPRP